MRERPILFSSPMVRAILEGRKTQTRRIIRKPKRVSEQAFDDAMLAAARNRWAGVMKHGPCDGIEWAIRPPYGMSGDRLWVRETWAVSRIYDGLPPREIPRCGVRYAATDSRSGIKDRPSIFMPRWASRLLLDVVSIRVERLQAITEEDARAEGVEPAPFCKAGRPCGMEHVEAFENLWDSINGKRAGASWDVNPWVWVVDFKRLENPHA